jgi:hypothetical protein
VTVEVDHSEAVWHPDTAVVYAGAAGEACCGPSVDRTCGHINFFTTPSAARAWADARPRLTRRVLGRTEALALAVAEFGTLLHDERHST